ncbi:class I fructose-bisphosphate aldolase [Candidatus Uhrbacteria bacterium]|nr:class I fructose-bisphosphate aldolase [Candidatus Uhrbacteria bacterium]
MSSSYTEIQEMLGKDAESLLGFSSPKIAKERLTVPSAKHVENIFSQSDRSAKVQESLKRVYAHGRLGGTGYLSIFPVDQGIEHSAGASFAKNPDYFDPEYIISFAHEAGCNAVASTLGVLGIMAKKYADKIPFIVKLNHNDFLRYPNDYDQTMFASAQQAYDMGARGVGATIYFGSSESKRQLQEASKAFAEAHRLGLFTVLWCYLRNNGFKANGVDYHSASDLSSQANHLGVTIEADLIKQKLSTNNGGYKALNAGEKKYGKYDERMYTELSSDHPIDLARYQVANCYMGRIGLINSGGESGNDDLKDAVKTAVINKRAGGSGLILGRKAFQKPREEGIKIVQAVQDVYLCKEVTVV